jgi:hypothetical protein
MASSQNERITFLATPAFKALLAERAAASGVSVGELIRRRMEEVGPTPGEEEELAALVAEVKDAIPQIAAAIDRTSDKIEAITRENDAFLRQMGVRK